MNLREAAEMALHALEDIFGREKVDVSAINALRAALAEADEPVAWRTEAARWLRRQADDAERDSECAGWANPARHMPATLRRIADDLEAEQEEAPYGMDCSPEPYREPLTEEQIEGLIESYQLDLQPGDALKIWRAMVGAMRDE